MAVRDKLEAAGFEMEDLFNLMRKGKPAMRHTYQHHARRNISYLLVARKRRSKPVLNLPSNRYQAKGRD